METVSKSNMMLLGKFISHFLESAAVILLGSFTQCSTWKVVHATSSCVQHPEAFVPYYTWSKIRLFGNSLLLMSRSQALNQSQTEDIETVTCSQLTQLLVFLILLTRPTERGRRERGEGRKEGERKGREGGRERGKGREEGGREGRGGGREGRERGEGRRHPILQAKLVYLITMASCSSICPHMYKYIPRRQSVANYCMIYKVSDTYFWHFSASISSEMSFSAFSMSPTTCCTAFN